MVLAASSSGGLFALEASTGKVLWKRNIKGGGGLIASKDTLYFIAADTGVYALDFRGNTVWRQGLRGGGEPSALTLHEDFLIFSLSASGMFILNARTGQMEQHLDPGYGISSAPTLGRNLLYVLSNNAVLYPLLLQPSR